MAGVPETLLPLITTAPPTSSTTKVLIAVCFFTLAACGIQYASPLRLTCALVAAIAAAEKIYLEAIESGILKDDVDMAGTLTRLQIKVSIIREMCLHNSLSYHAALCGFVMGNTFIVLQCLREMRTFEAHIEILKEGRLRASDATSESATRVVSLRQRHIITKGLIFCKD